MIMPFGKHKGKLIADVPVNYLWWVLANCENASARLRAAIKSQLGIESVEEDNDEENALEREIEKLRAENKELKNRNPAGGWERAFRRLAMKYHPDRGGDGRIMTVLNELKDMANSA